MAIDAEEFSQMFIGHRTFAWSDLVASLLGFGLGLFVMQGFLATYTFRQSLLGLLINQAVPMLNCFREGLSGGAD